MRRWNRAQGVGMLIAFGLALFVFGRWVVTVGSNQARGLAVHFAARTPQRGLFGAMRGGASRGGQGGGPVHIGFPSSSRLGPAMPHLLIHAGGPSGIPGWGRMLIWLGLIAIWAVGALMLLRDRLDDHHHENANAIAENVIADNGVADNGVAENGNGVTAF